MSSSREESPDWLREFQAPSQAFVTLSSGSDSSPQVSPRRSEITRYQEAQEFQKQEDFVLSDSEEDSLVLKDKRPKAKSPKTKEDIRENPVVKAKKTKARTEDSPVSKAKSSRIPKTEKDSLIKEDILDALEEGPSENEAKDKSSGPSVSSRLPLMFPDKIQRSKALVECDGDNIDLSGDAGAVGRIVISNDPAGNNGMLLDLKGTIYKSTIVPSRTFCIVSVGQSEAKIEAIMNDFIRLEPQSNVFEAETMIEGTLDGFSFDSDEEGEKVPKSSTHQKDGNNENGDQTSTNSKRKAEKPSGVGFKKAKTAGKPPKKVGRKPQTVKRTKRAKK